MKRQKIKFLILFLAPLIISSVAFAEEIGKFTSLEGKVDVFSAGRSEAIPATEGQAISVGDAVRTKSASKAEITFADNTIIKLAQDTRVEVKEYNLDQKGKRSNAVIDVHRGKIRAIVSKANGKADFTINTPNASGAVRGTDVIVFYQKSSTGVVVVDGKFSVFNLAFPDKVVEASSGNTLVIPVDEPPQEPRAYLAMEMERHEADTKLVAKKAEVVKAEGYEELGQMKATIVKVAGGVRIRSRDTIFWHDAKVNEVLGAGDEIETKEDGKLEIKLDNGNVINLKPNTKLILQKLTEDLQTGDYENLLECNIGKIRVQVEKIKGNSKFEIKTPTAVAAVKGTVLFLNILPNLTSAYFQGGNGTLTNIISGVTQVIADGNSSSADDQGNTSEPSPPSDEEKSEWTEGWEAEGGGEGYTSPGGGGEGTGTTEETGGGTDLGAGGGSTPPFNYVPFTELSSLLGGTTTTTTTTTTTETTVPPIVNLIGTASGDFGESGSLDVLLTGPSTLSEWPEEGTAATVIGTYSNPDKRTLWWADISGSDADGGAFAGWIGGSWHSWEGVISSIYVDPSGTAGNIFGYLSGTTDDIAGTFSGSDNLLVIPFAETEILPEELSGSLVTGSGGGDLYISFDGDNGYLDLEFDREMMKIDGENWGIWREMYDGEYDNPDLLTNWLGFAGGDYNEVGFFFSVFEGIDNLSDSLRMDEIGAYLDYEKLGAYYGTILGTYEENDSYYFEGVGLGAFAEEALSSSGWLSNFLYSYDDWGGYFDGLIGVVGNLWGNESSELASIGNFYNYDNNSSFIWFSGGDTLFSYDPYENKYTTYDGGAFYGMTSGIGGNNLLKGLAEALYIDPQGNAGVLSGNLTGVYSDDIEMYLLEGPLTSTQMAENIGILPEDLYDSIWDEEGDGILSGSFATGGNIEGEDDLYTMCIVDYQNEIAHPWGIYSQEITGMFLNPNSDTSWSGMMGGGDSFGAYYYRWGDGPGEGDFNSDWGYWIADITNGVWDDINAELHGRFITYTKIGTLDGDILGVYNNGEGVWQAVGLGTWEGTPLTFSGYWGEENTSLYNNSGYGNIEWIGEDRGFIGATTPEWWRAESFPIVAMGRYDIYDEDAIEPFIWNTQSNSYNATEDNSTTLDGGAFYGFTGGIWNNQAMDGAVAALYIDPDGNAGVLRGDVSGSYYPGIEMWQANGTLVPTQMAQNIGINPEDLGEYIDEDYIDNWGLYGDFGDDLSYGENYIYGYQYSGNSYNIGEDDHWGIFDIKFGNGNYYSNPEGLTTWSAVTGGSDEDGYGISYWLADLFGTWENGEIRADVTGHIISDSSLGTIEGDFFGVNSVDDGTWIGTSIGVWYEEPLTFSGMWGEDYYEDEWSLYRNDEGDLDEAGEDYGLIGSTTPEWWNQDSFPIVAMGEYWTETGEDKPLIWNTPIFSYNASEGNSTTRDGAAFNGVTAGIMKILSDVGMAGAVAAIYVAPTDTEDVYNAGFLRGDISGNYYSNLGMWVAEGTLRPTEMVQDIGISPEELVDYTDYGLLEAYVFDGFFGNPENESYSYIEGEYSWAETNFINTFDGEITNPWGIYDIKLEGPDSYYNPEGSTIWFAWIEGEGEFGEYDYDGEYYYDGKYYYNEWYPNGSWAGIIGGIWKNGEIQGALRALYVTEEYNAGLMQGDIFGLYDELEAGYGTWIGESIGIFTKMDVTEVSRDDFEEFGGIEESEFFGWGLGSFAGGGTLEATLLEGISFNISDQDWGIWAARVEGSYEGPTSPYRLATGGITDEEETCWLATISGDWKSGILDGKLRGVWLSWEEDDGQGEPTTFDAGPITGEILGTYDEVDTTWQAGGVGEWVELAELDPGILGFDNVALAAMVSVPITETYASLLQGTGAFDAGGSITGAMDISFYAQAATDLSGIWAALINGSYAGPTGNAWTLPLSDGNGTSATLVGTQWDNGQWLANVTDGVAPNSVTFDGQAGGTFTGTDSGTLTGVGAGTWETTAP